MAENFYTILTTTGKAKIANSAALGTKVNFKTLKVGDGNGAYYEPTENQTSLINKVWEGNIGAVTVDETNSNWIVTETTIPASDGGFFIREAGIFDEDGDLIAIAKMAATYKPVAAEGTTKDLSIRIILEVSNSSSITLKVDPNVIIATKKDIQIINNSISGINTQLSDMVYQTAGGSATAITLTIRGTLVNGYPITFIASANNGGAATTINGKKLYKPGTTTSPSLIAGKAYTVWYNSTGGCFFIKASAEGSAIAGHVLETDTFSNDSDTGIQGTLKNQPALVNAINVGSNGTNKYFRIPFGAYLNNNGQGYPEIWASATQIDSNIVSGNIKADANICGVQGKYSVVDTSDATAVAADIINGKTAYVNGNKIIGNSTIESLGGFRVTSGSISPSFSGYGSSVTVTIPGSPIAVFGVYYYQSSHVEIWPFSYSATGDFGIPASGIFIRYLGVNISGNTITFSGTTSTYSIQYVAIYKQS